MDIMSLVAKLTMDSSDFTSGLSNALSSASSFASSLGTTFAVAAVASVKAIKGIATTAIDLGKTVIDGASEVAAYGDNIDKASQKLGISAKAYQEWDAVLQHSGTSISSMTAGMKTLASKAESGSDAFKKLGISQKQAASMSREELFDKTVTALQNVEDANTRSALATELFGKSAMELGPLLNTSAEDTQAMKDKVHELGGVMSDEAVKAAANYQDKLQDMQTAMSGVKRGIVQEFLPGLSDLMDGFTRILQGEDPEDLIGSGLGGVSSAIQKAVSKLTGLFDKIMPVLIQTISDNLPGLMEEAAQIVMTIGNAIVQNLPGLVRSGLEIILMLANAITEALPELVPTIVDVVMEIVDTLTDPNTLTDLIDGAIAIIIALANGLVASVPRLIEKVPTIIMNLVTAIVKNAPKLLVAAVQLMAALGSGIIGNVGAVITAAGEVVARIGETIGNAVSAARNWGKDLILNFWEGIKAFVSKPIEAVKSLASKIRSFLGFSEPEEGPLSNFHTYAPDMMKLFAKGIRDNQGLITDAVADAFDLRPMVTQSVNPASTGQEIVVPKSEESRAINVIFEFDGVQKWVYKLNKAEEQRVGVKLAGGIA